MNKTVNGNAVSLHFNSITDVCNYLQNNAITKEAQALKARNKLVPYSTGQFWEEFSGTESMEAAISLLKGGWDTKARKIKGKMQKPLTGANKGHRNVYDVVGYQACVPRYLQGIPTSMVRSIPAQKKDKIINIYKNTAYSYKISTDEILEQSLKVLNLVDRLEQDGYRVNLYTITKSVGRRCTWQFSLRIKQSSQRLNIKQTAFPLCHPSMLRRIIAGCVCIPEELEHKYLYDGFGAPTDVHSIEELKGENHYFIPSFVSEKEITDINKYRAV